MPPNCSIIVLSIVIIVFSKFKICFSTSNNPIDDWNVYLLPGDPLLTDHWTDYPAIALSEDEFFVTGNLLADNQNEEIVITQTSGSEVLWLTKEENNKYSFRAPIINTSEEIILDICKPYDFPIIFNFPAGHGAKNFPIYMGSVCKFEKGILSQSLE